MRWVCTHAIIMLTASVENGLPADTRTPAQKQTLRALLRSLKVDYPEAKIIGHRDLPWVAKDCPCFDAREEYRDLQPLALEQ